jgi:hypothetical protein
MLRDEGARNPREQGTGGRDFEDYPPGAGPVPVGKAPLPDRDQEARLDMGIEQSMGPIQPRDKIKAKAARVTGAPGKRRSRPASPKKR